MRTAIGLMVIAVVILGAPQTAQPDVPQLINYQGILTDPGTGDPIVGTTPAVVSLYQGGTAMGGGILVYTESATLSTDEDGVFHHLVGSQATNADPEHTLSPSDFVTSDPVWAEVEIGGSPLLPRSQLVTLSYAMAVGTVDGSDGGVINGDVSITGGVLNLDLSTASAGNILKDGDRFIHDFGIGNTFIGRNAGNFAMTGAGNTAVGTDAFYSNTEGSYNFASGWRALYNNTEGANNTACGYQALFSNTTGYQNTASGSHALWSNTVGYWNTASGLFALHDNSTGYDNTASGHAALHSNTTGSQNTASGKGALYSNTEGRQNTAVGLSALSYNTTGIRNTALGYLANVPVHSDLTNATAIGYGAIVDASDKIRLGNSAVTVIEGQVGFTASSDKNEKENFRPVDGEEVLKKIRGLELTSWNYIGHDPQRFRHYGPMGQDFFAAFGHDDVGTIGTPITINSGDLVGILVIAVQALERRTAEVEELRAQVAELRQVVHQSSE